MLLKKWLFFFNIITILINSNHIIAQKGTTTKENLSRELKIAIQLMRSGSYDKSLIKCRYILRNAISLKDNDLIAATYNTIGGNFDLFSEPEKSFFYYNKGLIYVEKTNNFKLKNLLHNNLGNIYCFDKKEYIKGIYHYKKSLEYSTKVKDTFELILTNLNIAWSYFDINQFDQGYPYLDFVNQHHQKHGSDLTEVAVPMLNAIYYSDKNKKSKAISYFKQAIALGNAGNEKFDLALTHQEYAKFLKKTGRYKEAYEHLVLYNTITEQINNQKKLYKEKQEGFNLEIEEYKREIEKIESEYNAQQKLLIEEKSIAKKKLSILIIIILIGSILFYFYVQNSRLTQRNRLNSLRNKIQQNIINATLSGQETERKKIASFLHDNISALLSSAGLHLTIFSKKHDATNEEISKTILLLKEAHDKVRDLSHELIPSLLVRFGLFYALEDLCEKNSNSIISFEYESYIAKTTRYQEDFEIKIYFILTELINNTIKHSEATIGKIVLKQNDHGLKIQVFDNGKGFKTDQSNFFEGYGINQIRARVNAMRGKLIINSKLGMGTIITIQLPIE
ncbi:MAG: hypothetical protein RLZZ323_1093 [Bacteroidota bacterium]|jgi:signal transduction histidine kinase